MARFRHHRFRTLEREREVKTPSFTRTLAAPLASNRLARQEREEYVRYPELNKNWDNSPSWVVKDRAAIGPKAWLIDAALAKFGERDFADPEKRKAYRALRARQEGLRKVQPSGADMRSYHPDKGTDERGFAQTVYGGVAKIGALIDRGHRQSWLPGFHAASSVIPCIQRTIRREVMFALGHGGKGFHTKKRRTPNSEIPC